jgi:hypothetical protein
MLLPLSSTSRVHPVDNSGCSLAHPDSNEADTSDFTSSGEIEALCRDLFKISDCNFLISGGLSILSFPPQVVATSMSLQSSIYHQHKSR